VIDNYIYLFNGNLLYANFGIKGGIMKDVGINADFSPRTRSVDKPIG
jgi:hypothetical protein